MAETHTEVTRQSWGSRLGGAFKGILFGFVLIVFGLWLLFWNEGRAVRRAKALTEGAGMVVSVAADRVDPGNNGKLVHLSGPATTDEILRDDTFGVEVKAIHLERTVEMYQWRELEESKTDKKLGGGTETTTTYSYARSWSPTHIDSSSFKEPEGHENPASFPYPARKVSAQKVTVGAFRLSPSMIRSMSRSEPLAVESLDGLPPELRWKAKLHDGGIYIGRRPGAPEIGDVKVSFKVVRPATVSVVARQSENALEPYVTSNGDTIELLRLGSAPAEAMFQSAQKANQLNTWIFRGLGFLLIVFGVKRIFRPLSVMADVVPAVGNFVEAASGFVAYLLAGVLSLVTIAIAWLSHRPALAVTLLLIAGAGIAVALVLVIRAMRRNKPASAPA